MVEDIVCKHSDERSLADMRSRIEAAIWTQQQVKLLRLLGFQVAKAVPALRRQLAAHASTMEQLQSVLG